MLQQQIMEYKNTNKKKQNKQGNSSGSLLIAWKNQ